MTGWAAVAIRLLLTAPVCSFLQWGSGRPWESIRMTTAFPTEERKPPLEKSYLSLQQAFEQAIALEVLLARRRAQGHTTGGMRAENEPDSQAPQD